MFAPKVRFLHSLFRATLVLILLVCLLLAGILSYAWIARPDFSSLAKSFPEKTAWMERVLEQQARNRHRNRLAYHPVPLSRIPPLLQRSVILAEDASFWVHSGVDWLEIRESLLTNWRRGRLARGGSTISQQLVKNLYLGPQKTIVRKLIEKIWAIQMEKVLSKRRILELYLNCIEFGPGVFGVQAAAQHWFHRAVWALNPFQIVRLAAIIPSPRRLNPNRPTRSLVWRTRVIIERLHRYEDIPDTTYHALKDSLQSFFHR